MIFSSQLGALFSSNSKLIAKFFIQETNGFHNNNVCYSDTDSLYREKKYCDVLDKAGLVGDKLCQGKNDY